MFASLIAWFEAIGRSLGRTIYSFDTMKTIIDTIHQLIKQTIKETDVFRVAYPLMYQSIATLIAVTMIAWLLRDVREEVLQRKKPKQSINQSTYQPDKQVNQSSSNAYVQTNSQMTPTNNFTPSHYQVDPISQPLVQPAHPPSTRHSNHSNTRRSRHEEMFDYDDGSYQNQSMNPYNQRRDRDYDRDYPPLGPSGYQSNYPPNYSPNYPPSYPSGYPPNNYPRSRFDSDREYFSSSQPINQAINQPNSQSNYRERSRRRNRSERHEHDSSDEESINQSSNQSMNPSTTRSRSHRTKSNQSINPSSNQSNDFDETSVLSTNTSLNTPSSILSPIYPSTSESKQSINQSINQSPDFPKVLASGCEFLKYGKFGSPHIRWFQASVSNGEVRLSWGPKSDQSINSKLSLNKSIRLADLIDIQAGKQTSIFRQSRNDKLATDADLCFSLITRKRTLDLQAKDRQQRDQWINGLREIAGLTMPKLSELHAPIVVAAIQQGQDRKNSKN